MKIAQETKHPSSPNFFYFGSDLTFRLLFWLLLASYAITGFETALGKLRCQLSQPLIASFADDVGRLG